MGRILKWNLTQNPNEEGFTLTGQTKDDEGVIGLPGFLRPMFEIRIVHEKGFLTGNAQYNGLDWIGLSKIMSVEVKK